MKFDEGTNHSGCFRSAPVKAWFGNEIIGTGLGAIPLGDYWLTHKGRREYSGIEFSPTGSPTHAEMDNGGREALLHHLLHFDRNRPFNAGVLCRQDG